MKNIHGNFGLVIYFHVPNWEEYKKNDKYKVRDVEKGNTKK